jgi:hypothetical protein
MNRIVTLAGVCVLAVPLAASAQTPSDGTQPPANQGPMIVERIHTGFLISPEAKATRFDKQVKPLVGGSAGWVVADQTFFIGGGGYWMPETGRSDRELAYGGAVLQWFVLNGGRFGLSAKGLLGGGRATVPDTITQIVVPVPTPSGRNTPPVPSPPRTVTTTIRARQDFVVAEPEVNARFGLAKHVRFTAGAGYRFAGSDWNRRGGFDRGLSRRLSGATATFGIQIGG